MSRGCGGGGILVERGGELEKSATGQGSGSFILTLS